MVLVRKYGRALAGLGRIGVLAAICGFLGGCAGMTTYNTSLDAAPATGEVKATYIDAKQRGVFIGGPTGDKTSARLCAEPSPDALSALAASENLGTSKGSSDISQALSLAETSGSIGLRTAAIQLMRDEMYRTCEMYLSGAISEQTWISMHRRSQSIMVAILAIEQLTGTVKAQQVVLGGSASTGNADAVLKLTTATETARASLAEAEKAETDAETADTVAQADLTAKKKVLDAATTAGGDTSTAQKDFDAATVVAGKTVADLTAKKQSYNDLKQAFDSVNASRLAVLNGQTTSSASGNFADSPGARPIDPQSASAMTVGVSAIVTNTLQLSYGREICAGILENAAEERDPEKLKGMNENSVIAGCLELLAGSPPPAIVVTSQLSADGKLITLAGAEEQGSGGRRYLDAMLTTPPAPPVIKPVTSAATVNTVGTTYLTRTLSAAQAANLRKYSAPPKSKKQRKW